MHKDRLHFAGLIILSIIIVVGALVLLFLNSDDATQRATYSDCSFPDFLVHCTVSGSNLYGEVVC